MKEILKGIDELYDLFKKKKRIPLKEAAAILNIAEGTALKWAKALQEDGIIEIEFKDHDVWLVWTSVAAKPLPPPPSEEELKKKPLGEIEEEFRRLVKDYEEKIEEIKRKSVELQTLEKERASIIYKSYIPLERRFEAELQILNEQLAEKERQIHELEMRIREIPSKVTSVEEQARKLEQIEAYARKSVSESKVRIQAEMLKIREAQALIERHLKEVTLRIEEQTAKLKLIEMELIRLRKVEQWMELQQVELERRLGEISESRKVSLREFSALKATVTIDYVKHYMKELTALKERHASEIHKIKAKEAELNEKVRRARRELAKLTSESRVLLERFERITKKRKKAEIAEKEYEEERRRFERDLEALSSHYIE